MERRSGEQRLKIVERQGRRPHIHGHGFQSLHLHDAPYHLDDAPAFYRKRQARRQIHALRQHHGQAREGLRQQIPRVREGGEGVGPPARRQPDGQDPAFLVPAMDQKPDGPDQQGQQAQAVDRRPQGHGAEKHPAGPGARPPQRQQEQPAPQQERRREQGQDRAQKLLSADNQRGDQEASDPARQAQKLWPPAEGQQIPRRPQQRHGRRPPGADGHPAQGPRQLQQQPVHGEVVQQKPFQADPHATSTTKTVMSSRWPRPFAAAMSSSAMRSRGADEPFLSSASRSLPRRS